MRAFPEGWPGVLTSRENESGEKLQMSNENERGHSTVCNVVTESCVQRIEIKVIKAAIKSSLITQTHFKHLISINLIWIIINFKQLFLFHVLRKVCN